MCIRDRQVVIIAMSKSPVPLLSILALFFSLTSNSIMAGSVSLQWAQNPEPDVIGYRVHYGSSSGNYSEEVEVGNTTAMTVQNLANGTYFFVVTAYNTVMMESQASNEVSATVSTSPSPTVIPSATPTAV